MVSTRNIVNGRMSEAKQMVLLISLQREMDEMRKKNEEEILVLRKKNEEMKKKLTLCGQHVKDLEEVFKALRRT